MDEAIRILCASKIHQSLWLPATSDHERLRVTYATTSNFDDTTLPAVLFCSPMLASRYHVLEFDHLAVINGIRLICIDRPGRGGSTPAPLEIRIKIWLETVPILLEKLNVKHVSILSHSAGTMYALNTMYHLRSILDPDRPYAALIAPWVHNEHSKAMLWNVVSKLPAGMIDSWDNINRFIIGQIFPATTWSSGILTSMGSLFNKNDETADTTSRSEKYGVPDDVAQGIETMMMKYYLAEGTSAANEEAKLCLKTGDKEQWGICENYEKYVQDLCAKERGSSKKLELKVFHAASDIMIGKEGQAYFEKCWAQDCVSGAIDYSSTELEGTNHDSTITDLEKGAMKTIFEHIKQR